MTAGDSAAITIIDQRGETLDFDQSVRRVAAVSMPVASMIVAVDEGADHLVGMNDVSWAAMRDGILSTIYPDVLEVRHDISDWLQPDVEAIASVDPDVVVQRSDLGAAILSPIMNRGFKVMGVTYGTQHDADTWIKMFGAMLGKAERAQKIIDRSAFHWNEMRSVAATLSGVPPRILYFFGFEHALQVAGPTTYNNVCFDLIGGVNAARGHEGEGSRVDVSREEVRSWDPDIILLGNFDAATPVDVYSEKSWKDVSAVRDRRVYKVPAGGYFWGPPSHESSLMWRWLSKIAFPEIASGSLRDQMADDYEFLYRHTLTAEQIGSILQTEVNKNSANYQQFDAP